jgi:hypothetical protein
VSIGQADLTAIEKLGRHLLLNVRLQLVEIHHERVDLVLCLLEATFIGLLPGLPCVRFILGRREGDEVRFRRADHALEALIFAILGLHEPGISGSALGEQVEMSGESGQASVHLADWV